MGAHPDHINLSEPEINILLTAQNCLRKILQPRKTTFIYKKIYFIHDNYRAK